MVSIAKNATKDSLGKLQLISKQPAFIAKEIPERQVKAISGAKPAQMLIIAQNVFQDFTLMKIVANYAQEMPKVSQLRIFLAKIVNWVEMWNVTCALTAINWLEARNV